MTASENYIIEILQDVGLVTQSQVEKAIQNKSGDQSPVDALVASGLITREDVARTLAAHSNIDFVDLSQVTISSEIIDLVPQDIVRRYKVIPVALTEAGLVVAIADPLNFETLDSLRFLLKREVELVCATEEQIKAAMVKYYGTADEASQRVLDELGQEIDFGDIAMENVETEEASGEGDAPIIKMVTMLILEAHKTRASDIHLEPLENRFRVRFRIDGKLQEMQNPPKRLQSAIISRIKIMTGTMSIAEKRLPQDGRIQIKIGKKPVDLRVSTVPTTHGESIVMRILDKTALLLGLSELGFLSDDQETMEKLITLPDGILLVTGPTGSGKSTTLYACLNYINKPDRKIITVEDPVEYQMPGINQVQVAADIGMTFPAALRSMLRQAPNIIMIGEIRDAETANIAINASLTGHLVLSTLHTNDAPSAIARLIDIGVPPFLISSSLRAALAQRLIRKLCQHCRQPSTLTEAEMSALRMDISMLENATIMAPKGCEECRHIGFRGRLGIFEIFIVNDEVRNMINERATTLQLRARGRENGMRTLREDGVRKVLAGTTSADEVISVTMADAD